MKSDQDFRSLLKRELEQRMNRNPRYSLRAFAKDMKVAPALLSDILNGKRGMSRESATRFAERLGLNKRETEFFCDLVESKHARSRSVRKQAELRLKNKESRGAVLKFLSLNQEKFNFLSDWYHLALLELMKTPSFVSDLQWMAKRLGLSTHQISAALERMQKFGVVELHNGNYRPTSQNVETPDGVSSRALKVHHEQFINKAVVALHTQPLEERDFRGLTIHCKKSDVEKVRAKLRQFLIDLDEELSRDGDGDEVYQLSTQFFSLTQSQENKE